MGQSYNLSYNVDVKANINSIKKLTNDIQNSLDKVNLPLGSAKGFNSNISTILNELKELERLSNKTTLSLSDTKSADKSWEKISASLGKIKVGLKDLGIQGVDTAKAIEKLLPSSTITKFKELTSAIEKAERSLKGDDDSAESKKLKKKLEQLQADKKLAEQDEKRARLSEKEQMRVRKARKIIKEQSGLSKGIASFENEDDTKEYLKALQEITDAREKLTEANKKARATGSQDDKDAAAEAKKDRDEALKNFNDTYGTSLKGQGEGGKDVKELQGRVAEYKKAVEDLAGLQKKLEQSTEAEKALKDLDKAISDTQQSLTNLGASKSTKTLEELAQKVSELTGKEVSELPKDLEALRQVVTNFKTDNIEDLSKVLQDIIKQGGTAEEALAALEKGLSNTKGEVVSYDQARQDIEHLQYQVREFFSISNAIQIFKRTVREAFETVKELDAVMTETAVVTDFTVGDMWDKLPQYAKQASALGTSIKDLYSATTLYYQQGLNSDQAMSVGIETMKMARIANMDASDATQAMTAALRGFNMEIDEISATRINDVYSELAAITAADTNQIATAMTKTASIADSANMEFETTAALLAQIIETTQEAPETAGTAMKTIIARFTEVKKLFNEGMLSGEDSEGEVIEINKIDAALRTVGISLADFLRGEKGIDDIFLELASKWDTLDLATQRYIATTAAGSRQQSRFIAMMSNYDRTMELVAAANNSAGASQNQYEKTLDSMEAKLQKLQNAWDVFVMNLANNDVLKFGVDLLTSFLETINGITDALSGGNGLTKSLISFMAVFGALRGGRTLLDSIKMSSINWGREVMGQPRIEKDEQGVSRKWNPFVFQQTDKQSLSYTPLNMMGQGLSKFIGKSQYDSKILEEQLNKSNVNIEKLEKEAANASKAQENARIRAAVNQTEKDDSMYQNAIKNTQRVQNELNLEKQRKQEIEQKKIEMQEQQIKVEKSAQTGQMVSTITTGIGILSSSLATVAKNNDLEGLGTALETIGTTGIIAGQGIGVMNQALFMAGTTWSQFFAALGPALPYLGVAAAAIGAIGVGLYQIWKNSPEGKLKTAEKQTKQIAEDTKNASASYDNLSSSLSEIDKQKETLNNMIKGTQEWKEASTQLNQNTLDLISNNKELADAVSTKDGLLILDQNKVDNYLKAEALDVQKAKVAQIGAEINEEQKRLETIQKSSDLLTETRYMTGPYAEVRTEVVSRITDSIAEGIEEAIVKGEVYNEETLKEKYGDQYSYKQGDFEILKQNAFKKQAQKLAIESKQLEQAQAIKDMAAMDGVIAEFAENLDSSLIANMIEKRAETEEEGIDTVAEIDEAYREYADMMGYTLNGTRTLVGADGQTLKIDQETVTKAVANARASKDTADFLKTVDSVFEGTGKEDIATALLGEGGESITAALLGQIGDLSIPEEEIKAKILKQFNYQGRWEDLADELDVSSEVLYNTIIENIESATDRIAKQRKNLVQNMEKYSKLDKAGYGLNQADAAFFLEQQLGEDIVTRANDLITKVEISGDDKITSAIFSTFEAQALKAANSSGSEREQWLEYLKETEDIANNIDWSNSINAFSQLSQYSKTGSDYAKKFASSVLGLDSNFLSIENQFKALTTSADFEEMQKSLSEIYETQGKITEADVRELAKSYKQLDKFMNNTSTTADGLANILNEIQSGDIGFENITSAVLAVIGSMDTLGEAVSKVLQNLRDFNLGEDLGEIQDTYSQWGELLTELRSSGEFGNEQYENILNRVFGESWDEGLNTDAQIIARMTELTTRYQQILGEGMGKAWIAAAEGYDVYGDKISEGLPEGYVLTTDGDGNITFQIPDSATFEQAATIMKETFGGTAQLWSDMIGFYTNLSPMMSRSWIQADYNNMGQAALEEARSFDGKRYITEDEIDTIASTVASSRGKEQAKVREDLIKQLEETGIEYEIIPKFNKESLEETANNIISTLDKGLSEEGGAIEGFIDSDGLIDWDSFTAEIDKLNLDKPLRDAVINGMVEGAGDAVTGIKTVVDGQQKEIKIPTSADTEESEAEIVSFAAWADSQTSEATLNLNTDPAVEAAANAKAAIDAIFSALSYTINLGLNLGFGLVPRAKGDPGATKNYDALVGEEGPELIETKDGAYLSGVGGPQITQVRRGDVVHTAEETREIFNRRGIPIPAYKGGTDVNVLSRSGGKGSSEKGTKDWENPFDKLYNLVRKIDEELRERERIERRYEKLLEDLGVSANKIIAISREELNQLEKERKLQEQLVEGRKEQIKLYQQEKAELSKYANIVQNERGESVLRIDWDLIDSVKDPEQGQAIEDYVSQLEEWFDSLTEAEDALWEIEDTIKEINERGREEFFDLEDLIKDAVEQNYQDQIDKLSEINDSINDTNAELLEGIQRTIDKQRQDRENEKTEEEIADKQHRLSYLQMDTSGANATEILKLQQEIEEAQEDYTDSLIDQKISDLQEQNDEAAKQREKQIDLLQAQLDHYLKSGQIWQEVNTLMKEGLDKDSGLIRGSRLEEILQNEASFAGLSAIGQQEWWIEMDNKIAQALAYLEVGRQIENLGVKKGSQIDFYTEDGKKLTGKVDDKGNVTTADGKVYNNVYQGADGLYYAGKNYETPKGPKVEGTGSGNSGESKKEENKKEGSKGNNSGNYVGKTETRTREIQDPEGGGGFIITEQRTYGYTGWSSWKVIKKERKNHPSENYIKYASGGLVKSTGPAWLDGTKSRPELVLNQRDTQNFIQLKDILSSIFAHGLGNSTSTENNGDVTYDIDINVESIGSDYDVDKVASRVKSLITQDARYRNNNAVSLKR